MGRVIFCINCESRDTTPLLKQLLNGEYECCGCHNIISATRIRDYLLEKIKDAEQQMGSNVCGRCGRELKIPDWCSWCGSEPLSPEAAIQVLKEQVDAVEREIQKGEPLEFRKAREGDEMALAHVMIACEWKPLKDLGQVMFDFLIAKLGGTWQDKEAAVRALGYIGDKRAVEPLIELLAKDDYGFIIFQALDRIGIPARSFRLLLAMLLRHYPPRQSGFTLELEHTAHYQIFKRLLMILENSAAEVAESDLITVSQMEDVIVDTYKYKNEGPHYLSEVYELIRIPVLLDCSPLRQAAQQELTQRGLI